MSFITGLLLIDCPASALNNAGAEEGARTDNAVAVKYISTKHGAYPYISAQSFKYWLRTTLEQIPEWKTAPVYREKKIAYTDANPLQYYDDDLFGYMRAPSKKTDAVKKRSEEERADETATSTTITRVSPFRMSTLVSLTPVRLTHDFGTMSRHEGDPVPHEHQFYKSIMRGIFSIDLKSAGSFSYKMKTGYLNLDDNRIKEAEEAKLEHIEAEKIYRLPLEKRRERVNALLKGMAVLSGGAKQAIHYTDVTPSVVIVFINKGGNNPLQYIITADSQGLPKIHTEALEEMLSVWKDQIISKLYIGWVKGFCDSERETLEKLLTLIKERSNNNFDYITGHPKDILEKLAEEIKSEENSCWWE